MGIGMLGTGGRGRTDGAGRHRAWILVAGRAPGSEDKFNLPLASGFIAGDALVALVIAIQLMLTT